VGTPATLANGLKNGPADPADGWHNCESAENSAQNSLIGLGEDQITNVSSRSKPITITPVRTRTGGVSYRVMGTLHARGKQVRKHFGTLEEAEEQRLIWEGGSASLRLSSVRTAIR
jgi:hypothetical protein